MGQQTNSQQVCKSTSVYSIGLDLGGCNGPRTPRVGQDHLCSLGLEHGCDVLPAARRLDSHARGLAVAGHQLSHRREGVRQLPRSNYLPTLVLTTVDTSLFVYIQSNIYHRLAPFLPCGLLSHSMKESGDFSYHQGQAPGRPPDLASHSQIGVCARYTAWGPKLSLGPHFPAPW